MRAIGLRLAFGLSEVAIFGLGSVGAFLAFDWPPLLRQVVLAYLVAAVVLRLVLVLGRFLLAPDGRRAAGCGALPRHPVVRRRRPVLVSAPGALRRVVRLRAGHARCPQRPGVLARGARARGLYPRARAPCHRPECRLDTASRSGRPSGRHAAPRPSQGRPLASVPLPGAALGVLGRGVHAPVLALGGRAPPARGDQGRPDGEPSCLPSAFEDPRRRPRQA